jgi:hypothetical protein
LGEEGEHDHDQDRESGAAEESPHHLIVLAFRFLFFGMAKRCLGPATIFSVPARIKRS